MAEHKSKLNFYASVLGFARNAVFDTDKVLTFRDKVVKRTADHPKHDVIAKGARLAAEWLTLYLIAEHEPIETHNEEEMETIKEAKRLLCESLSASREIIIPLENMRDSQTLPPTPMASPAPVTTLTAQADEWQPEADTEEEEIVELMEPSHGEPDTFRHNVEKILSHHYRQKKNEEGKNTKTTTFLCKWEGFDIKTEEEIESAAKAKRQMREYLTKISTRARNTLLKRHANLLSTFFKSPL